MLYENSWCATYDCFSMPSCPLSAPLYRARLDALIEAAGGKPPVGKNFVADQERLVELSFLMTTELLEAQVGSWTSVTDIEIVR